MLKDECRVSSHRKQQVDTCKMMKALHENNRKTSQDLNTEGKVNEVTQNDGQ